MSLLTLYQLNLQAGGTLYFQSAAGTLTTSGALVKQARVVKVGALTPVGVVLKQVSKSFTGTVTTSGALASIKTFLKALTATLTTAGALVKQARVVKSGTVAPIGDLVKQARKAFGAVLVAAGAVSSNINALVVNFVRVANIRGAVAKLKTIIGMN